MVENYDDEEIKKVLESKKERFLAHWKGIALKEISFADKQGKISLFVTNQLRVRVHRLSWPTDVLVRPWIKTAYQHLFEFAQQNNLEMNSSLVEERYWCLRSLKVSKINKDWVLGILNDIEITVKELDY